MKRLKLTKIIKYASAELLQGNISKNINRIVIDSRKVKKGDLFIAIIGENQDGHKYIKDAVNNGAAAVLLSKNIKIDNEVAVLKVNDTIKALQDIAFNYRKSFEQLKVIAVTGSAGKTTTKDMIFSLLSQKFNCLKTAGNYNNHIGLPLTLLNLEGDEKFIILEMGMSARGEIKRLAEIADPDIGIITNVGAAHLEQLGSIENIARAKQELIDYLAEDDLAILNADNKYTFKMGKETKVNKIYFGFKSNSDLQTLSYNYNPQLNLLDFKIKYKNKNYNFQMNKAGKHNIYNVMAALIIALELKIEKDLIQKALLNIKLSSLRMDIVELDNGSKVINDSYNANPMAVKAALNVLTEMNGKRKIAVLASMLELGEKSKKEHLEIGEFAAEKNLDLLITVGKKADDIADGARKIMASEKIISLENNKNCIDYLSKKIKKEDLILIKGSRSNKLEEIVDALISKESEI